MSSAVVRESMVKKVTLLELHLDDARFSNAVGGTPEEAAALLDDLDANELSDVDADDLDDLDADDLSVELPEASERSVGRTLRRLAVLAVLAVGVRTVARRVRSTDEADGAEDADEDSVAVDLGDRIEA
jgi:hypothetical protein